MAADTNGWAPPGLGVDAEQVVVGRRGLPRVVAVASDGSALADPGRAIAADSVSPLLNDDAAGLHRRAWLSVWAKTISARDGEELAAHLLALPATIGAIFLTHTDPVRARIAQRIVHEAGGASVVTEADTTAISLTAALLTAITRAGYTPATSRVIIAGSAAMPDLCPLLIAIGVGDISGWNASDSHAFPLHHLASHATAVIDLVGATTRPARWIPGHRASTVLRPDDPSYRLLPAPGLFAALVHYPHAAPDVDVFQACALALAAATPRDHLVPDIDDRHLTEPIASAVLRILAQRTLSGPSPE